MNTIKHRILDNIETLINQQTEKGIETYGHTLDDCPHNKYDWQQMIIEELIDALQYQQKEISQYREAMEKARDELDDFERYGNKCATNAYITICEALEESK